METIKRFLEDHKYFECTFDVFVQYHENCLNTHNHTVENLFLYFSLENQISKGRVSFYPGAVFINDNRRYKWFITEKSFLKYFDFSNLSPEVKKKMIFYSPIVLEDYKNFKLVESKIKECVYTLSEVFDEDSYYSKYKGKTVKEIKKKIYNRFVYPFKFLQREELGFRVEDLQSHHLPLIEELHASWCKIKLDNPNTFKMMFSSNRYNRCIKEAVEGTSLQKSRWFKKAFFIGDKLIAVRLCLLVYKTSYDIAFFSRFWDAPSNISNYINTWCLREMKDKHDIVQHNCGAELDKYLKQFKSHYPSIDHITYKYNFKKDE